MALSNYYCWDSFHQYNFNAEATIFAQTESNGQLPSNLQACSHYLDHADYSSSSTDHIFSQHNMFYPSENYDYSLPGHYQEVVIPHTQKLAEYHGFQDYPKEVPMPSPLLEYPPMAAPVLYMSTCVTCDGSDKRQLQPTSGGSSVSAQSIAARQRRRKITDKTQQLGKLIPGGQRMNTAEMFGAAHKYIKFLQAQVGILEFAMKSHHQENEESLSSSFPSEEYYNLHGLLESMMIQEKLSSAEKCLVPSTFVEPPNRDDLDHFALSIQQE